MRTLDRNKVYDLSELTSEDKNVLLIYLKNNFSNWNKTVEFYSYHSLKYNHNDNTWYQGEYVGEKTNAKELFYTLENVQVNCRGLSQGQINEMADVVEDNKIKVNRKSLIVDKENYFFKMNNPLHCKIFNTYSFQEGMHIITYEKFMELFSREKVLNKELTEETNNMVEYMIERTDGIFKVNLIKHKTTGKYSFVNLTKGHICSCIFNTLEEAEEDFKKYKNIISIYKKYVR